MALSASDLPAMYSLLANSLSGDESLRKPAETALSQSESRPGFCSLLMEVITAKNLESQVDVRLMASVYFKNSINRYWRNRRDSTGISNEEKIHLRQKLLSHLREENYQIALMLAVLISKIARFDYPKEWPELFSVLAQQLQSSDILTSHRIFMILFRTLKELSTKRLTSDQRNFAEISSHFFDYSWHLWQSDVQTILHGFSTVSQNFSSTASDHHHDELYLMCERWLLCLKIIRQLIISGFQSDVQHTKEVRPVKEVSPVLLNAIQSFLPYYSSFQGHSKLWDFIKRACIKLMKVLVTIHGRHPYSFGDKSVLPLVMDFCLNKITDPEPDMISFEQFLIQCMVMVKNVLECKEYKPSLTGRVTDENGVTLEQMKKNISSLVGGVLASLLPSERIVLLCNILIRRYFVLTASDLEEWHQNPESFHHEQDMVQWSEKLRPCAEALYIVLFENHSQLLGPVVVSILQEAMNGCPTSVTEITPGLLLKDAAYGAAAYVYYELSNYLSFKDWFNGALSLELSNDHPNMRIIHRKVALILGQWVSEIKDDIKRPVYCALIRLLQGNDLSVRLAACRSLCQHIEDANFSEKDFSDLLPICWDLCFKLVEEVQEFDSKLAGSSSSVDKEEIFFDFRKQRFIYSREEETFRKLPYPSKETFGYYLKHTGHGSEAKVISATEKWGRNVFEYPQPTFQKLMKENCMEPFFIFQVFCVGLWCLDEYWYYSLFTLFMLFMFESTMAKSRLKTLTELRRVRVNTQTLMVHRCGRWVKLCGTDLLPGDVVSIGRSSGQDGEDKCVPADLLILAGSVIVNEAILTGESTPQWKVSIMGRSSEDKFSTKRDKSHVLFGGTKIMLHTTEKSSQLKTPDGGCLAVVLRTGFGTSQGKLMRTILFSTERVTANSWESGFFILFLVVFAVIAAGYVLKKGLEDPTRSKYKLFLSCSLIITSVIPPELPMELSIAVNTSLIALARRGIFCTEPFRIPFAGKVDICCFDKTGTLTSDDMEFCGVVGSAESERLESDMTKMDGRAVEILASCHALVYVDNKLVGDPIEKTALQGIGWSYKPENMAIPKRGGQPVHILQRHHFASHLKRMTVVVNLQEKFFAFVKGAPETIQERLVHLPLSYVETYKKYTRQGSRVLALAFKPLPEMTVSEARSLDRDIVETGLTFAGFAVFNCPIRADSATILSELKGSSHDLVMITGDQALTACHVAGQVNIISKPTLILGSAKNNAGYEWISPDESESMVYSEKEVADLSESHDLCVGGDCFEMLQQTSAVLQVVPYVKVFARVAPEQKELIMTTFKMVGRMTLMCGDGTNDVGALKQAHVGVALLNAVVPAPPSSETSKDENTKPVKSKKPKPSSESSKPLIQNGEGSSKGKPISKSDRHLAAAEMQRQKLKKTHG